MSVSIKDLAEMCGVSIATVSRVINNKGKYSDETRQKVLKAIQDSGYQINNNAKSLRTSKSNTIGILVPDIANTFFSSIVKAIEEKLFIKGYSTLIANTDHNQDKEEKYLNIMISKQIEGLIVISGDNIFDSGKIQGLNKIPIISIDRKPKQSKNIRFVSSNHYEGGKIAAKILLDAKSTTPAIAYKLNNNRTTPLREQGFFEKLKQNNIKIKNIIQLCNDNARNEKIILEYLKVHPNIDGIFAVNDKIAILIHQVLSNEIKEKRIKLVGFDNIEGCSLMSPSITSIKHDVNKIAEVTINNLFMMLESEELFDYEEFLIDVEIVERETTR